MLVQWPGACDECAVVFHRLEVDPASNDHSFVDLTRKKLGESPSDAVMLALSQPSSSSAGGISDGSCTTTSGGRRKVRIPSILLCEEEEPVTRMEEGGEGERSASEASEKVNFFSSLTLFGREGIGPPPMRPLGGFLKLKMQWRLL